ncbi:hypothetical protein E5163_02050 [Marinicauda algicola]|uniref:Uncharacterized protein n=1 Tax=Marinicauda algicola TaxID=2029849 RepID=A0A4S2H370_9PROT|nr:DUF2807 domain-containing protein [Marinicauda algicola]TGY89943.1 hypothetical protein E5163_02050 [Marinicauda algicola]
MLVPALFAAALVQAQPAVEIENFAGRIEIVSGPSLSAELLQPGPAGAPRIVEGTGGLTLDGGLDMRRWRCHGARFFHTSDNQRVGPSRREAVPFEDLASVRITVPEGTAVSIRESIVQGSAGDLGALTVEAEHCGNLETGAIAGDAGIALSGSMDVTTGDVGGAAEIAVSASGDVRIGDAGRLSASLSGSGDVQAGDVRGPLAARLTASGDFTAGTSTAAEVTATGSGDVELGAVAGRLEARLSASGDLSAGNVGSLDAVSTGSGDVDVGDSEGPVSFRSAASGSLSGGRAAGLDATLNGSGGAYLAAVEGAVAIVITASGDVEIDAGRAEPFSVRSTGSGDVSFGGTAVSPQIDLAAGGGVYVQATEGAARVQSSGSGAFRTAH